MENASKALIIAGAILLSILIISLGIMIFNQASSVIDNNAMSELEITSFNQKFDQYFGERVRGGVVNSLISAVNANNNAEDDTSKKIEIKGSLTKTENGKTTYSRAATGQTYKVEATNYTTGGLISEITITANT